MVDRACCGQGVGTAAAPLVTQHGLAQLGLAEIHAEVLQRNHASVRLLQKAGFHLLRAEPPSQAHGHEACFVYMLRT